MTKTIIISSFSAIVLIGCTSGGKQQSEAGELGDSVDFSGAYAPWPSDTMKVDEEKELLPWEEIPDSGEAQPIVFEKWLKVMNHIKDNHWARPTAKMLADLGLEVLYERDKVDKTGIKDVHLIYGRQTKCMTDSAGNKYHTFDGSHAVLFTVLAYTSSGAEINFHNPVDLKNFMQQAIKYGVAECPNGDLVVCDKPMGEGIHKTKKVYEPDERKKGEFAERYYIGAAYEPGADWQTCYVTLDFLRHRMDIDKTK